MASHMDRRSSLLRSRILGMLLDEVPDAADQAEALSRRMAPILQVR